MKQSYLWHIKLYTADGFLDDIDVLASTAEGAIAIAEQAKRVKEGAPTITFVERKGLVVSGETVVEKALL